jgi:broad specificity phosphatase PhoE
VKWSVSLPLREKTLKKATGMQKTTIYVIRHAQSEHNLSGSLSEEPQKTYGTLGSPLTEEGKRQASMLARELKRLHIDCILASHLNRARQTAEIFGEALNLPIKTTEALQERLTTESEREAGSRLFTFLQEAAHEWREKNIAVVSHGAIFRAMLILLGFAATNELPAGSVANTGYAILETDGERWVISNTQGIIKVL